LLQGKGLPFIVLFITTILIFFCLGLSHANSPNPDNLLVKGQISETNIQCQADQPDPSLPGEEYFVNYRLARERSRQEIKGMLEALLNSPDVNNRAAAQRNWLELSTKINQECELENLLKIKGFRDVIADVNKDSVSIIILTQGLNPYEVFSIRDTVNRVTEVYSERITIEIKK
jgi:stage III sporulation protein AH